MVRQILLPRPHHSKHRKPITAWLYFARPESELETTTDLILDFPGGGFVTLGPNPHHEERLRKWAIITGKPVLSIDYGKAPECEQYLLACWQIGCSKVYRSIPLGCGRVLRCVSSPCRIERRCYRDVWSKFQRDHHRRFCVCFQQSIS